jgi:hypothetical protein
VATRIWASIQFNDVWVSPEGHVLHVNTTTEVVTVENESGAGVPLVVNANTEFFFRAPQDAVADGTPIGTGIGFLSSHNLVRGFKVHASVVDPLATPLVAQTVDIETAAYDGKISAPTTTGFTDTRNFRTASDDYVYTLDYIAAATANGDDSSGNPITGFKWWNFAYPTLLMSGTNAITDFIAASNGAVNFGGTIGAIATNATSFAVWNDPASPNSWAASATVLDPSTLPLGTVATGLVSNAFTMTVAGGMTAATIDVSITSGSATLVYQVDRTNGVVTVSRVDITTSAGLTTLTNGLAVGALVKVYGVPQGDGSLRSYVLTYYTGEMPAQYDVTPDAPCGLAMSRTAHQRTCKSTSALTSARCSPAPPSAALRNSHSRDFLRLSLREFPPPARQSQDSWCVSDNRLVCHPFRNRKWRLLLWIWKV